MSAMSSHRKFRYFYRSWPEFSSINDTIGFKKIAPRTSKQILPRSKLFQSTQMSRQNCLPCVGFDRGVYVSKTRFTHPTIQMASFMEHHSLIMLNPKHFPEKIIILFRRLRGINSICSPMNEQNWNPSRVSKPLRLGSNKRHLIVVGNKTVRSHEHQLV